MPWEVSTVSEARLAFVYLVRAQAQPVAQAARSFGISRKTAYKWLGRVPGVASAPPPEPAAVLPLLGDRSRRPSHSPARTADPVEQEVLAVRDRFGWGARKIHAFLAGRLPALPSRRTVHAILARHGRLAPAARPAPPPVPFERDRPNQLWQLDFKGPREVARRCVCPLAVVDDHSRYLVALHPCLDLTMATAWDVLWDAFGRCGLPEQALSDNAFGCRTGPHVGVSWFDARLLRLGIRSLHGRPYHPQTQGKVERFHGALEAECYARLPAASFACLDRFSRDLDGYRHVYNTLRPHEALGDRPPVRRWVPSPRPRPADLPPAEAWYPAGSTLRRVSSCGEIRWRCCKVLVGRGTAGDAVRVEETGDAVLIWYAAGCVRRIPLVSLEKGPML
jgi:transposase InsO family protein